MRKLSLKDLVADEKETGILCWIVQTAILAGDTDEGKELGKRAVRVSHTLK